MVPGNTALQIYIFQKIKIYIFLYLMLECVITSHSSAIVNIFSSPTIFEPKFQFLWCVLSHLEVCEYVSLLRPPFISRRRRRKLFTTFLLLGFQPQAMPGPPRVFFLQFFILHLCTYLLLCICFVKKVSFFCNMDQQCHYFPQFL